MKSVQSLAPASVASLLGTGKRVRSLLTDLAFSASASASASVSANSEDGHRQLTDYTIYPFAVAFAASVKSILVAQGVPVSSVVINSITDTTVAGVGGVSIDYSINLVVTSSSSSAASSVAALAVSTITTASAATGSNSLLATILSNPALPASLSNALAAVSISVPVVTITYVIITPSPTQAPTRMTESSITITAVLLGLFVIAVTAYGIVVYRAHTAKSATDSPPLSVTSNPSASVDLTNVEQGKDEGHTVGGGGGYTDLVSRQEVLSDDHGVSLVTRQEVLSDDHVVSLVEKDL